MSECGQGEMPECIYKYRVLENNYTLVKSISSF